MSLLNKDNVIIDLNSKVQKCAIEGCDRLARLPRSKYCSKHERQIYRHGKVLERTCNDLNEIVKYDNYAEVILYNSESDPDLADKITDVHGPL